MRIALCVQIVWRGFRVASLFLRNRSCHRVRVHRAPETVILRGQQKLKIALICEHIPYDKKTSAIGTLGGCASLSSLVLGVNFGLKIRARAREKPIVQTRLRSIAKHGRNMQLDAKKHFQAPPASDRDGKKTFWMPRVRAVGNMHLFRPRRVRFCIESASRRQNVPPCSAGILFATLKLLFPTSLCRVLVFRSVPPGSSSQSSSAAASFVTYHLCHIFIAQSVTRHLSHTIFHTPSLSHTIFHIPSLSQSIFSKLIFTYHLCHTPSFTHPLSHTIFVTRHLSHTLFLTHHHLSST